MRCVRLRSEAVMASIPKGFGGLTVLSLGPARVRRRSGGAGASSRRARYNGGP
jgi:hypothetical protein